jgi:hypothetical protein
MREKGKLILPTTIITQSQYKEMEDWMKMGREDRVWREGNKGKIEEMVGGERKAIE